ncbi:UNVERIFIED_CONTAM: hypothetical protein GTU68_054054, partial [Idotea baltica]|nr:hypothetical protein [Idotea baltica]
QKVSKGQAGITDHIRNCFDILKEELSLTNNLHILEEASWVYNCDQSCIQMCLNTGKVLGIQGKKIIYQITPGPEKSNLTFIGYFNTREDIVNPGILYPYVRIPADIDDSVLNEWYYSAIESGWMNFETFKDYIQTGFIPWLTENNIQRPVILFVDRHHSHISMQLSLYCQENGVILYLLPPNTTHILQPANVGPFKPLRAYWRKAVLNFKRENPNSLEGFIAGRMLLLC